MRGPVVYYGSVARLSGQLDNREVNEALMAYGMGYYVISKPNRRVVMRTGNPHMISKIHPAAGDHVRASVTIVLIRPGQERTDDMR